MFLRKTETVDINSLFEEYKGMSNAVLVDVRSREEYLEGHLPGSINIPLDSIEEIAETANSFEQKIYLYCLSGYRSSKAQSKLSSMGYTDIVNMGAFSAYSGEIEY